MTPIHHVATLTGTIALGILFSCTPSSNAQVVDTAAVRREVDSLVELATKYLSEDLYREGIPIATRAKDLAFDALGEMDPAYPKALNRLGSLHYMLKEYTQTKPYWLKAKALREKIFGKHHPDYAGSLTNLGVLYTALHNYRDAESNLLEGLEIRKENPGKDHTDYSASLNNLGQLYYRKGDFQRADSLWTETLERRAKNPGKESTLYGEALINLGSLHTDLGGYEKAERYYREAMEIFPPTSDNHKITLGQLASLYQSMGKLATPGSEEQRTYQKQSETCFLQAKALFKSGQKDYSYATVTHNQATLYTDMGRFEDAEKLFMEVQAIYDAPDAPLMDKATSWNNQGDLYATMGNMEKAKPLFEKAFKLRAQMFDNKHPEYIMALLNLAQTHRFTGKHDSAVCYFVEAFNGQRRQLNEVTAYLAEGQALHHLQQSEANIYLLYSFLEDYQTPILLRTAYDHALLFKGNLLENMRLLDRTIANGEDFAQQLYWEWKVAKQTLGNLYLADEEASLSRDGISGAEDNANELEKSLLQKIPALQRTLQEVRWEKVQAALKPGEAAIEFIHYRYSGIKVTQEIKYAALILLPGEDAPRFVPLCAGKQLDTLYENSQRESGRAQQVSQLYVPSPGSGKSLYELVWKPLEPALKGTNTVYYAPSGLLHRINLAAIATKWNRFISDGTSGKRFHLVGSTRRLANPLSMWESPKITSAKLYGGIDYGKLAANGGEMRRKALCDTAVDTLRGSAGEVMEIQSLLEKSGIQAELFAGSAATEESFTGIGQQQPAPSILHIATHGYFLEASNPIICPALFAGKIIDHPLLRSGLLLADVNHAWVVGTPKPGRQDGLLTAYEISQTNLTGTELAVLSACKTGLGDIAVSEGVFGLQRAFKMAGVHYVVMSLWEVPDSETKEFMTLFYKRWLTDKLELRTAFEQAQRAMREKYKEPYYWASFLLME